jgi:hypothetical protein
VRFWDAYEAGAGMDVSVLAAGIAVRPATGDWIADSVSCDPLE